LDVARFPFPLALYEQGGRWGQQADIESHACAYAADWEPYAKPDEPDEAPNSLTNIPKKLYL